MKNKKIDYYGTKYNYIHLKFGNAFKMWNFTEDFIKKYPGFHAEYLRYATGEYSRFKNAYSVIKYIIDYKIPVNLYFNFTDEPATPKKALKWWFDNNTIKEDLK